MATQLTEKTIVTTDRSPSVDASRAPNPIRRFGPIVGGLVVVATAATILVGTILPSTAPRATALPPMSNSFGYYDHILATGQASELPPMSNSFGYYDHLQATTKSLPPMSNSLGFWDHIQGHTATLPPMSNSLGYWDHIAAVSGH